MIYCPDSDTSLVKTASSWLQNIEENLSPSLFSWASAWAVMDTTWCQLPLALVRGKGSPRCMPCGIFRFFLRDWGEDMRKWVGDRTFKLEANVRELRGKAAAKKRLPKKSVSLAAVEAEGGDQQSSRCRRTEIASLDSGEWTSGVAL